MKTLDKEQKDYVVGLIRTFNKALTDQDEITEQFLKQKGLIEESFKVGWYKSTDDCGILGFMSEVYDRNRVRFYGIDLNGKWNNNDWVREDYLNCSMILMTPSEVSEALIKEAKKRGFKEGVKTECLNVDGEVETIGEFQTFTEDGRLLFGSDSAVGWCCIMDKNGKWAEIIEEKEEEFTTEEKLKAALHMYLGAGSKEDRKRASFVAKELLKA